MIEVINPGIFTSIQDPGRPGFRSQGVPLAGVMDREAASYANGLSGNSSKSALIEFASPGPILHFSTAAQIAIVGKGIRPLLNGKNISTGKPVQMERGDMLEIGRFSGSFWGYLAVRGGIDSPVVLNSQSQCFGVTSTARIFQGGQIKIGMDSPGVRGRISRAPKWSIKDEITQIDAYQGPDFYLLDEKVRFGLQKAFKLVNPSTRMAYTLAHKLRLTAKEVATSAVQPGTVQLTPSGQLIVLMRDSQTTGGYARVLQLTEQGINQMARLPLGAECSFNISRLQLLR